MERPLGERRPLGPFVEMDRFGKPPETPSDFNPPSRITDHEGNERYWTNWQNIPSDEFIPSRLRGVTGLYYPEQDWAVVDDRVRIHHSVQVHESEKQDNPIPDMKSNPVIPFATDYITDKGENSLSIESLVDSLNEVSSWESHATIPETGSFLFHEYDDVRTVTASVKDLYKMIYPLRVLGIEPKTKTRIKYSIGRLGIVNLKRDMFLEDLYREMRFKEVLPDVKVERDNNIKKPE